MSPKNFTFDDFCRFESKKFVRSSLVDFEIISRSEEFELKEQNPSKVHILRFPVAHLEKVDLSVLDEQNKKASGF